MRWKGEATAQRRERERQGFWRWAVVSTQMSDGDWVWLEPYFEIVDRHAAFSGVRRRGLTEADARRHLTPPPGPPSFGSAVAPKK